MVNFLVIGVVLLIVVRMFGVFMFLYVYYMSRRKFVFFFVFIYVVGIFEVVFDFVGMSVENFFIVFVFVLVFVGFFYLIWEDLLCFFMKGFYRVVFIFLFIFGVVDSIFEKDFFWDIYFFGGFLIMMFGIFGMDVFFRNFCFVFGFVFYNLFFIILVWFYGI